MSYWNTQERNALNKGVTDRKGVRRRRISKKGCDSSKGSLLPSSLFFILTIINGRLSLLVGFQPSSTLRGKEEWSKLKRYGQKFGNVQKGESSNPFLSFCNVQSAAEPKGFCLRMVSMDDIEKRHLDADCSENRAIENGNAEMVKLRQHFTKSLDDRKAAMPSYDTALCVVPEDSTWDAIQRARHMTGDNTLYVWPPCIRLFHPFVSPSELSNVALDVASEFVEKHEVTRFDITLSNFVILPWYALDQNGMVVSNFKKQASSTTDNVKSPTVNTAEKDKLKTSKAKIKKEDVANGHYESRKDTNLGMEAQRKLDYDNIQNLIAKEERIGKEKLLKRQKKEAKLNSGTGSEDGRGIISNEKDSTKVNTKKVKYNGPCILCLEPDEDSGRQLKKLRALLHKELFPSLKSIDMSASTVPAQRSYPASKAEKRPKPPPFRPAVTLGRFSTVEQARECKKRLEATWEPLTVSVTDLQLVCRAGREAVKTSSSSFDGNAHREDSISGAGASGDTQRSNQSTNPFNCDSIVYFVGEERDESNYGERSKEPANKGGSLDVDSIIDLMMKDDSQEGTIINLDEVFAAKRLEAKEKAKLLMKEATGKRAKRRRRFKEIKMPEGVEVVDDEMDELLSSLLPEVEEDWNEGATIFIGRTQFFLGEMREYVGMPAVKSMELKESSSGTNSPRSGRKESAF